MITVSNLWAYASASRVHKSHWTRSTLEISNSSAFLLNMFSASLSMSKPTHKLQKREHRIRAEARIKRGLFADKTENDDGDRRSHPASSIAAPILRTPQPHPRSATSLPPMSSNVLWIV